MKPYNIRTAKLGDELQIGTVHVKSWQEAYKGIISSEFLSNLSIEERTKMWKGSLERPPEKHGVYVVEGEEGNIVGFATGGSNRSKEDYPEFQGELYAIYLLSDVWGKGIGEQLTTAVIDHLKRQGMTSMIVWVLADNPARNFYERLGANIVGEDDLLIDEKAYIEIAYGFRF